MSLDAEMQAALSSRQDVSAIACMDGSVGLVLGMCARAEIPTDAVELALLAAPQLCSLPEIWGEVDGGEIEKDASIVVSESWVHAFARVRARPGLILLGLAKSGANVALLTAWLREVADRVGAPSAA